MTGSQTDSVARTNTYPNHSVSSMHDAIMVVCNVQDKDNGFTTDSKGTHVRHLCISLQVSKQRLAMRLPSAPCHDWILHNMVPVSQKLLPSPDQMRR